MFIVARVIMLSIKETTGNETQIIYQSDEKILAKNLTQWPMYQRWGPYLQTCLWEFNMGKLKFCRIIFPLVYMKFRGSNKYSMWEISGSDLGQISPIYRPAPLAGNPICVCVCGNG